jgi:hypothetical protein
VKQSILDAKERLKNNGINVQVDDRISADNYMSGPNQTAPALDRTET